MKMMKTSSGNTLNTEKEYHFSLEDVECPVNRYGSRELGAAHFMIGAAKNICGFLNKAIFGKN